MPAEGRLLLSALALGVIASCAMPRTTVPVPSGETRAAAAGWHDGRPWTAQHEDICRAGREGGLDLVFLGDSITQSWGGPGRRVGAPAAAVWERWYGRRRAANFGISGDRTEHVLWRIENGAFDGIAPAVVVVQIGTNNLPHDSSSDIALGVRAVVNAVLALPSEPHVLLMTIPPRGRTASDPLRKKAVSTNRRIHDRFVGTRLDPRPSFRPSERVTVVDLWPELVEGGGGLNPELMRSDGVHFAQDGYEAWARALEPHLRRLGH